MTLRRRQARSLADTDYSLNVGIRDFSRPLAHATIEAVHPGAERHVEVLVAHLKSKLPTRLDPPDREPLHAGDADALGSALSTIRRAAEAAALRLVCNDLLRDGQRAVVLLGDLNDGHRSVTTELIAGPHHYRLFAASRAGEQASRGMYAAATLHLHRSQRDVYYTYIHEGAHESLDHILVSQHFYDYSRQRRWSFRQMRVLNDHLDDPHRQAPPTPPTTPPWWPPSTTTPPEPHRRGVRPRTFPSAAVHPPESTMGTERIQAALASTSTLPRKKNQPRGTPTGEVSEHGPSPRGPHRKISRSQRSSNVARVSRICCSRRAPTLPRLPTRPVMARLACCARTPTPLSQPPAVGVQASALTSSAVAADRLPVTFPCAGRVRVPQASGGETSGATCS
jgi:hypothetical protein